MTCHAPSGTLALALVSMACGGWAAEAAAFDLALNGYIRSGVLITDDGTRGKDVGLMTQLGKFRLGNEQNTKIELLPKLSGSTPDGVIARFRANLTHETQCTADWNCSDADGHDLQVREGYAEIENLPFAPGVVFWAGKRYSSSNTSNHQYDWEYIQYNGTGGGFDRLDLGLAKMDLGLYAFTPSSESSLKPADPDAKGHPDNYSLNLWLKSIGGSGLDLQLVAHHMKRSESRPGAADSGHGVTALYRLPGFYGISPGGYSRIALQYGKGLAAGNSLGKNGWGWANLDRTQSWRLVFDALYTAGPLDIATFAFYQKDRQFRDWSSADTGWGRSMHAIGVRPQHRLMKYLTMQYELGWEHYDESDGATAGRNDMKGDLYKATIAPTLTFGEGFWARPQLRAFATYAKWDRGVSARLHDAYTRRGNRHTVNYGVQAEVWF